MNKVYPVVIIGGGPIGLSAAAHLVQGDVDFLLLEMGATVGDSLLQWQHVKMFSSWSLNTDPVAVKMLSPELTDAYEAEGFPTGGELVHNYLQPLAEIPAIASRIQLNKQVKNISRQCSKPAELRESFPFVVEVMNAETKQVNFLYASKVIDASGTWKTPSPMGGYGFDIGEECIDKIETGVPNVLDHKRDIYTGKDILVFGSGHSAIAVINDLVRLQEEVGCGSVTWVIRSSSKVDTGGACKPNVAILPGRGELESGVQLLHQHNKIRLIDEFYAQEIQHLSRGRLLVSGARNGKKSMVEGDRIVVATGCRPDLELTRELQMQYDHRFECSLGISKLIADAQSRGEAIPSPHGYRALAHPEPGYFVVGMKSHGRAQNFFLMSGYEQIRSVCSYILGDIEAAERIEFAYPENGVCGGACAEGSCCGPATSKASGGSASACGAAGGCCG